MRYLVGRACAVAGYAQLYHELDLLPEVSIAEEARENGATAVFNHIMASTTKYAVLDDYTRTIHDKHLRVASLNGDTCVRSLLDAKQKYGQPSSWRAKTRDYDDRYFNITEDMCVDEFSTTSHCPAEIFSLLYTPLPVDLPTVHKDLLILSAAYYGNIDRYARLRRPVMIRYEVECVVRGIYHYTMFAKWWSLQTMPPDCPREIPGAVDARFIMNNDLSRIEHADFQMPYCIWYPAHASAKTYEELVRLLLAMANAAAHACIVCNYQHSFDKIDSVPDYNLWAEAKDSRNLYYQCEIERKAAEHGIDLLEQEKMAINYDDTYPTQSALFEPSSMALGRELGLADIDRQQFSVYETFGPDFSAYELKVCAPADTKIERTYLDL
ncbi:hypothetical protein LTS18_007599 [Coniosporium uncinatum]|uniref:Uncharacterized protein n=1 Tax=Coniosporium uncinatum TaxID=93489 RepID=A0ACC3DAF1_9PEZI|nr:hypothetical protein LTS18_007599 [Coniosporium uncinatum]